MKANTKLEIDDTLPYAETTDAEMRIMTPSELAEWKHEAEIKLEVLGDRFGEA